MKTVYKNNTIDLCLFNERLWFESPVCYWPILSRKIAQDFEQYFITNFNPIISSRLTYGRTFLWQLEKLYYTMQFAYFELQRKLFAWTNEGIVYCICNVYTLHTIRCLVTIGDVFQTGLDMNIQMLHEKKH